MASSPQSAYSILVASSRRSRGPSVSADSKPTRQVHLRRAQKLGRGRVSGRVHWHYARTCDGRNTLCQSLRKRGPSILAVYLPRLSIRTSDNCTRSRAGMHPAVTCEPRSNREISLARSKAGFTPNLANRSRRVFFSLLSVARSLIASRMWVPNISLGQDGRKGRWFSLLFKMGERSGCGPRLSKPFRLTRLPSVRIQQYALSSGLFPESILLWACFPSSSSKIDVIVGTPSDVLVGCARPVPRRS